MGLESDSTTVRCFGQRMLSPFRGVMHCVETEWADAVTVDGRRWTLYVRGECLYEDPAELEAQGVSVPDVKFATWSERSGLQRAPIRLPTFDERVRFEGERLLQQVRGHAAELPFGLADRYELWLLHAGSGMPLALIGSACKAGDCAAPPSTRWTPGQVCMADLPEAVELSRLVERLAGDHPRAAWFERQADGSGRALQAESDGPLPASCFAPLFIDPAALGGESAGLIEALHLWQAPALLQLPDLSEEQRRRFEAAACSQAMRLAENLPLYPCVLDRHAVTAALVEARLRRGQAQSPVAARPASALSPDYIEVAED